MADIKQAAPTRVRWLTANYTQRSSWWEAATCCECGAVIRCGEKFAHYVEILSRDEHGRCRHIPRDYCADCGKLLEDSLTTTEAVS